MYFDIDKEARAYGAGDAYFVTSTKRDRAVKKREPYKKNRKQVEQYDMNDALIDTHNDAFDAAKSVKVSYSSIVSACNGKQDTAAGYKWKYKQG